MKKIKNIAVICLAAVMFVTMTFSVTDIGYAAYAETADSSEALENDTEQALKTVQETDGMEEEISDNQDIPEEADQRIYVDGMLYTGSYLDADGVIYTVTEGVKGAAVSGIMAKGTRYYDSVTGKYMTLAKETVYVNGKVYSGYYMSSAGYMYKISDGTAAAVRGLVAKGKEYYSCNSGTMLTLANDTVYIDAKPYNGYYLNSAGKMYKVSSDGTATLARGSIAKGKTYYSYNSGKTLTLSKNRVYVSGKLYTGYYLNSAGKMYKVSKGTATLAKGIISKGKSYYSYNSDKTLKLAGNRVYVSGKIYSGYYLNSAGKMYKVSSKGVPALARGTILKGNKYYSYSKSKTLKLAKNTVYLNGKKYSGYYMSSGGYMYKVKNGTRTFVNGTLSKGTKYYSYSSAKTLKLTKKTVFVKGKYANIWVKQNGTWCYYNSTGKLTFKSNVVYNNWKKINSKSSSTNYFIVVDLDNTRTIIFKGSKGKWAPIRSWSCSPGKASTPTVKGTYTVKAKGYSFGSGYTCYYYTQFYGDYLFHSILYNQGTFTVQDGRLGQKLSHGCVRLSLKNAKWIYDNIPRNTKVYIY